ncbi:acyltransferase [Modestobacter sp. VKM Ac-2979]|uniref:acyltransferase family protein n=1 Tax=unclassified Modestobacter TaxID=2643866 RepID=UPI0022AB6C49|nr:MULTISPECIES: acyltransferase [unclassified Modestobacter]MCZ2813433.1 acyltransferase [Modestobacter sp. VKM Ac-2979]MCZ2842375.1 acyltransferase [Modestobacter sp. VKM Ac-2980]
MTEVPTRPQRVAAIDVARAVAIIGVAANHSIDGMLNAGLIPADHPLEAVNSALYLFRMPALAFLLGLFVPRAVTSRGAAGYVRERATLMLYLYLLWFLVQSLAELATNEVKNVPRDAGAIWRVWEPFAHLWFLPFLIVTAVVLAVLQPWQGPARRLLGGGGLVLASLLTWGWNPTLFGLTGLSLLAFAAAGSMVGLTRLGTWMQGPVWAWTAVGLLGAASLGLLLQADVVPSTLPAEVGLAERALSLGAAVAGTVALLAVSVLLTRVPPLRDLLAAIGRRTLPIYLAHVLVVAGVRIVLVRLGIDQPYVIATLAVLAGVGIPFAVATFTADRPWANWLFDLPRPLRNWSRRTTPFTGLACARIAGTSPGATSSLPPDGCHSDLGCVARPRAARQTRP